MLGKLLKHEFKATSRLLLPLYLVLFVLTIINRVSLNLNPKGTLGIISGFLTFAYIFSIVAIAVITYVIVIYRFYKNLMTDEGYLMFTLPVKPSYLINAKLLVAIAWNILSFLLIIASLLGVFITDNRYYLLVKNIRMLISQFQTEFSSSNITIVIIEFIICILLSLVNNILIIYTSITIGQLFNSHKILGSFAAYISISTLIQIIVSAAFFILSIIFNSFDDISSIPRIILPVSLLFTLATNILYYIVTNIILTKKLNLE